MGEEGTAQQGEGGRAGLSSVIMSNGYALRY